MFVVVLGGCGRVDIVLRLVDSRQGRKGWERFAHFEAAFDVTHNIGDVLVPNVFGASGGTWMILCVITFLKLAFETKGPQLTMGVGEGDRCAG
jgi:hypothetical protein